MRKFFSSRSSPLNQPVVSSTIPSLDPYGIYGYQQPSTFPAANSGISMLFHQSLDFVIWSTKCESNLEVLQLSIHLYTPICGDSVIWTFSFLFKSGSSIAINPTTTQCWEGCNCSPKTWSVWNKRKRTRRLDQLWQELQHLKRDLLATKNFSWRRADYCSYSISSREDKTKSRSWHDKQPKEASRRYEHADLGFLIRRWQGCC